VLTREASLRLPAFAASVLAVLVVYLLARRTAGRTTARFAGALMAVWPVCVLEGVEARGYSLMMLFSALATLQLVIALERRRAWMWLLYACWVALGAWAHMVTTAVALGHGIWLVWRCFDQPQRRAAMCGLASLVLAAVITLALYAPALPEIMAKRGIVSATTSTQPGPFGAEGLHALLQLGGAWLWWAALPGLACCVLGAIRLAKREHQHTHIRAAIVAGLVGLPVFYLLVLALGTWVYARFALFAVPGAALLAAVGWDWLRERAKVAAIGATVLAIAAPLADLATRPPKQPLREASDHVFAQGGEGSRVLVLSIAHEVMKAYEDGLEVSTSMNLGASLDADLARNNPGWVILLYPDHVAPAAIESLRAHGFTERARFDGWVDWGRGDVVVLERLR
jgi:4-amino-4-deoxy-L-arabinose transferase-like glycosyltransferase